MSIKIYYPEIKGANDIAGIVDGDKNEYNLAVGDTLVVNDEETAAWFMRLFPFLERLTGEKEGGLSDQNTKPKKKADPEKTETESEEEDQEKGEYVNLEDLDWATLQQYAKQEGITVYQKKRADILSEIRDKNNLKEDETMQVLIDK